jgi:hypothetical protein
MSELQKLIAGQIEDVSDLSAEEQALSPTELRFCQAFMQTGVAAQAARASGHGNEGTTAQSFATIGMRLLDRPKVQDALRVLYKRQFRSLGPVSLLAIKDIVASPNHKDRLKAAAMVADRLDLVETKIAMTVEHKFDPVKITLELIQDYKKKGWSREMLLTEFSPFELAHFEALIAKSQPLDVPFKELPAPEDAELLAMLGGDDGQG